MSDQTVLNIKISKDLKKQAQQTAKALGLPVSTLVAASLRDIVARQSITISSQPRLRPEVEAELLKISADARKGINVSPEFNSLDKSLVWLSQEVANERAKH